jgi:predicted porin
MMQKKVFTAALVAGLSALAGTAQADDNGLLTLTRGDSSLSLYGILDAAYAKQNHAYSLNNTLPNQSYSYVGKIYATAPSQSAFVNGGLSDSRLGIKGSTGLVGDTKAIFDLESGFDLTNMKLNNAAKTLAENGGAHSAANLPPTMNADSSLNGQLFGRAAWVGVQAGWGTLTYGTQNNPVKDAIGAYDPVKSDTFSPFGESGTVGGGVGSSEESRLHHSVKYTTKFGDGFDASVAYQFGNDWNTSYGHTYAARVGYENGSLGVTAAYSNSKDAIVAGTSATLGDIALKIYDVDGYLLAAKYKVTDAAHFSAGYEHYQRKAPGDAYQPIGSIWGYTVSTAGSGAGFTPGASQAFNIYFAGGDYDFTPDLNLAVGYYNTKADQLSTSTNNSTDYTISTWSTVLKYKMTKALDLYAAATVNSYGGGVYNTAAPTANAFATNVSAYGAGARFKF